MLIEYRGKNEDRQQRVFDKVHLIEGFNDVNPTLWEEAIAIPAIKAKIEQLKLNSIIVIVSEDNANQSLEKETIPEATRIVKETLDLGLLKEWKDHETRKGVVKAIDEQIAKIETPVPAEDDKK